MTQIIDWLSNNTAAGTWALILVTMIVLAVILMYLIAFKQGREISFWPPKIGHKPNVNKEKAKNQSDFINLYYLSKTPQLIMGEKKNRLVITSEFILWEKCTILVWIYVTPQGSGIRNAPHNRYIFGHHTGNHPTIKWRDKNVFAMRYSLNNKWVVIFNNATADESDATLSVDDKLNTGWHHFLISWDKSKPSVNLLIDEGLSGNDLLEEAFRNHYPELRADNISVGSWPNNWEGHYCETQLYNLQIINEYYENLDNIIRDHIRSKPS